MVEPSPIAAAAAKKQPLVTGNAVGEMESAPLELEESSPSLGELEGTPEPSPDDVVLGQDVPEAPEAPEVPEVPVEAPEVPKADSFPKSPETFRIVEVPVRQYQESVVPEAHSDLVFEEGFPEGDVLGTIASQGPRKLDPDASEVLKGRGYDPNAAAEMNSEIGESDPSFSEIELIKDKGWLDATRIVMSMFKGKTGGWGGQHGGELFEGSKLSVGGGKEIDEEKQWTMSDKDVGQWGLEMMGWTLFHLPNMMQKAGNIYKASEEERAAFYKMMTLYENKDISWEGTQRAFKAIFSDPTTYAGLWMLGVGAFFKVGARQASLFSFKQALRDSLAPTVVAAIESGIYTAAFEKARQNVQVAAGVKDEVNWNEVGGTAALGTVAGGVFGSGFGLTAEIAKFARNKIDLGRRLGPYFPDIDGGLGYKIGARLAQKGYSKAPPPLSGAGTPAATKSPSVAGLAAMRSATDMTDGSSGADQTLRPRSQTTTWEPPSDRPSSFTRSPETFRMSDDISQEGIEASTISKALQNLAGTRKYQDTADLSILVQRLEELEPAFTDDLVEVVAALGGKEGGVEFSAVRLKASDAIEKKLAAKGIEVDQISDGLAGRLVVNTLDDVNRTIRYFQDNFHVLHVDDFHMNPRPGGYRAAHIQIYSPKHGVSAEVQIQTPEVRAIQDYIHGLHYAPFKTIARMNPEQQAEYNRAMLESESLYNNVWARLIERTSATDLDPLGFFSAVSRAVDNLPMEKGGASQMRAMIAKGEGVKPEEMAWIGLDDFLKGRDNVTKKEIRDFVDANRVEVKEVTKGMEGTTGVGDEVYEFTDPKIDDAYDAYSHRAEDIAYELETGDDSFIEDVLLKLQRSRPAKYPEVESKWANSLRDHFENGGTIKDLDADLSSDIIDAIDGVAKAEYLDNPYVTVKSADGNYTIYGNDDIGYQITRRNGGTVNGTEIYSLEEAKIQAYTDAMDEGLVTTLRDGDTLFENYTIPGGENYREVLLTLPDRGAIEAKRQADAGVFANMSPGDYPAPFTGGHFDEPNVLAHIRLDDRVGPNGEKILFIEEIQSDWHQKGRKQGYHGGPGEKYTVKKHNGTWAVLDPDGQRVDVKPTLDEAIDVARQFEKGIYAHLFNQVPNAPLKKTWHEMAFRRVMRMASKEGYDVVAWTPGKMQAERYALSKHISEISYDPDTKKLLAYEKDGYSPVISKIVSEDKLADYIGKEAAERLLATTRKTIPTDKGDTSQHILKGADLEIGGEGMKGFYDKMLKKYAEKFGKKFGAKVGVTQISANVDPRVDPRTDVWSLPVTKEMRDSAVRKGVPLFGAAAVATGAVPELSERK